jgi:hypothetical protein
VKRALAAVFFVAAIAAGCGGSSLRSIAVQQSKQFLDEPSPKILSIETVRIENGDQHAIARLEGHFRFVPSCPGPAAGHKSHCGPFWTRYAVLELSPSSRQFAGYWGSSATEETEYAAARQAAPQLGIFPDFANLVVRCTIPGGWGGTIAGTCSTQPGRGKGQLELAEHWPLSRPAGTRYRAGWIVSFDPSGKIASVIRTGDLPPQLWKSAVQPPVAPRSVTRARAQLDYLRAFPSFSGTKPCAIPGGGPAQVFHGTCTTKLLPRDGNRPRLAFLERWRAGRRTLHGGWIVTLRHDDRVLGARPIGATVWLIAEDSPTA